MRSYKGMKSEGDLWLQDVICYRLFLKVARKMSRRPRWKLPEWMKQRQAEINRQYGW